MDVPMMPPMPAIKLRCTRVFAVHEHDASGITCCVLDARGRIAVAANRSGVLVLWDTVSGTVKHTVVVSNTEVSALCFSDDSRHLLVGCISGSSAVLDSATGKVLRMLDANASAITEVYFEHGGGRSKSVNEMRAVTVCGRQAKTWDLADDEGDGFATCRRHVDFIADGGHHGQGADHRIFRNSGMVDRTFVAHSGLTLYDPCLCIAMYDEREYVTHPGNSVLFREGTSVVTGGPHREHLVMFSPPGSSVTMLADETDGVTTIDFSSDGMLLVSGNHLGFLSIWDTLHHQLVYKWPAHKKSAITCVKFSHDSKCVYSCGEDTQVILWNTWTFKEVGKLTGHKAPVVSVDMSHSGLRMVSGDQAGVVAVWSTTTFKPLQVLDSIHVGAVLCTSISPDGVFFVSSGEDEGIHIFECETGKRVACLDECVDGRAFSAKFSFDGTRVMIGSATGAILIWSVEQDCLLYDIKAHEGCVHDCSWSGDSRRLLSVGSDGLARLWDSAAGSELAQAYLEAGFTMLDSGGIVKCDLSLDGTIMTGCTAKGHLIQWDIGTELRRVPNGHMLYDWLAGMPGSKARDIWSKLLRMYPLLFNAQDSRGWTVLMHASYNCDASMITLILSSVSPRSACIGLMASPLHRLVPLSDGISDDADVVTKLKLKRLQAARSNFSTGSGKKKEGFMSSLPLPSMCMEVEAEDGKRTHVIDVEEPNAISIAIMANTADCAHLLLNAVLDEKVTPGSYHPVTKALCELANTYPDMCERFLTKLPLKYLGELSVPSHIAAAGTIVKAANSYTSYKELWVNKLHLDQEQAKGSLALMEAVMVQLPFAAALGSGSLLHQLSESNVGVKAYGSGTVHAIISYKWKRFARRKIYTQTATYLTFLATFTVYAVLLSDDPGSFNTNADGTTYGADFAGLALTAQGLAIIVLSFTCFAFGAWFMRIKVFQLYKLGPLQFFMSIWNIMDVVSYSIVLIFPPCVLLRVGVGDEGFVSPLVAAEIILLWARALFYGLAVDGLGTFVFMIIKIIKGLKYFYLLLLVVYISFGVALLNLFRAPPSGSSTYTDFAGFTSFGPALLSMWYNSFQAIDPLDAAGTMYPTCSVIVMCLATFLCSIVILNLIITLMGDLYLTIKKNQDYVFQRNRAELVLEIESTMNASDHKRHRSIPPYLHLLRPINLEYGHSDAEKHLHGLNDPTMGLSGRPQDPKSGSAASALAAGAPSASKKPPRPGTAAPAAGAVASAVMGSGHDTPLHHVRMSAEDSGAGREPLTPGRAGAGSRDGAPMAHGADGGDAWRSQVERAQQRLAGKVSGLATDMSRRMDRIMSALESMGAGGGGGGGGAGAGAASMLRREDGAASSASMRRPYLSAARPLHLGSANLGSVRSDGHSPYSDEASAAAVAEAAAYANYGSGGGGSAPPMPSPPVAGLSRSGSDVFSPGSRPGSAHSGHPRMSSVGAGGGASSLRPYSAGPGRLSVSGLQATASTAAQLPGSPLLLSPHGGLGGGFGSQLDPTSGHWRERPGSAVSGGAGVWDESGDVATPLPGTADRGGHSDYKDSPLPKSRR